MNLNPTLIPFFITGSDKKDPNQVKITVRSYPDICNNANSWVIVACATFLPGVINDHASPTLYESDPGIMHWIQKKALNSSEKRAKWDFRELLFIVRKFCPFWLEIFPIKIASFVLMC